MIVTIAFYFTLCAAACWFAAQSCPPDRRHALQVAAILSAGWVLSNFTWINHAWQAWPVLDAGTAWFVAIRLRMRPDPWKIVLMVIGAEQMRLHIGWNLSDKTAEIKYSYTLSLNVLFALQLACAASPGFRNGCSILVGRVRRRFRRGDHVVSGRRIVQPGEGAE